MLEVECTTDSAEEVKWPTNPIPRSKNLPNTQFTLIKKEHKMLTTAQSSIWKDGQLATDLSNERTLLAWIRMSGSLFGLAMAFLKVDAIHDLLVGSILLAGSLLSFVFGSVTYFKLKTMIEKGITAAFHKAGLRYFVGLVIVCFVVVAVERSYRALLGYDESHR
eukprot:TRINITY_DN601_c0_g2_i17.p1 TRINITY_DN601_c0_g2~~TRINITY_DN601_c0_g2_i17.p1  ORF type:complete len:164 (-),score=17.57 TRINITY_DN601_c0_g2_i17:167-658(-)